MPAQVGVLLAVLAAAAVAVRRRWPLPALAVAVVASCAAAALNFTRDPLVAPALVLYTVATVAGARVALNALLAVGVAVGLAAALATILRVESGQAPLLANRVILAVLMQLAVWVVGRATQSRHAYAEGLREQAEQHLRNASERAHRALADERLRIARELHDVLAHSMSVIAVQAGVGHHVIATQPQQAADALAAIEGTSRAALAEIRRLLGILRDGTGFDPLGTDPDELLPAPGLADLPTLARRTMQAGLHVDLRCEGDHRDLPAGLDLAAYRIVQEALTNVVKHAGTDHGTVVLTCTPDSLRIEVTDEGLGAAAARSAGGHGLIGMRERVALYNGDFHAGPLPARGFRVTARLPLDSLPLDPPPVDSRPVDSRPLDSRPLDSRPLDSPPVVR